jgi:hypothetical protein
MLFGSVRILKTRSVAAANPDSKVAILFRREFLSSSSKKESISTKFELPSSINFSLNDYNTVKKTGEASSVPMGPSSSEMCPVTPASESSCDIKRTHIVI